MRVRNSGDWALNAFELVMTETEYQDWIAYTVLKGPDARGFEIAKMDTKHVRELFQSAHYWLVQGKQVIVYIEVEPKSLEDQARESFVKIDDNDVH